MEIPRGLAKSRLAAGATAGALLFGGCTSGNNGEPIVRVVLDYTQLMEGGTTCQGGGERPCFSPLRAAPQYDSPFLNRITTNENGEPTTVWPFEHYRDSPKADELTVVCQVTGDTVRDSSIWDVIEVAPEHIEPAYLEQIENRTLTIGHERDESGVTRVYAMIPDYWAGNHGEFPQLPDCSTVQNPLGYPAVR
jgi:hypothetical protein